MNQLKKGYDVGPPRRTDIVLELLANNLGIHLQDHCQELNDLYLIHNYRDREISLSDGGSIGELCPILMGRLQIRR